MPAPAEPTLARRAVLLGVAGTAALGAGGCGIRLEDDAPDLPLLPARDPIPAEPALLTLTSNTGALAWAARSTPGALAARLAVVHDEQLAVLRDALLSRGVPAKEVDRASAVPGLSPGPSGTSTATPSPSSSPSTPSTSSPSTSSTPSTAAPSGTATPRPTGVTPAQLAALEERPLAALEERPLTAPGFLSGAAAELRPTLVALLAQRVAAVTLLRGRPPAAPGDLGTWTRPAALVPVVTAGRETAYLMEVAAAQGTGAARSRALRAVGTVTATVDQQVVTAGDAAPLPGLGVPLPFPVVGASAAARLERYAVDRLRGAYGASLASLTDPDALPGLLSVPCWLGEVEVLCRRAGLELSAFPGLAG
ncbi:MAG TPA: hypothetical protein VES95_08685 [Dermatophilaceae bacterium]|nr:hypothetical protein [Dermatophilaceae bacterium]